MATKTIYLRGFGYMEVPAELTGRELSEYAAAEARKSLPSLGRPVVPEEPEKKPEVSLPMQVAAGIAGLPAGLASGLVGSTLEGIGGLTGIKPVEEAGVAVNEYIQEKLRQAVGEEAAASRGAQIGQTIGGIASFFTPGVAAKVLGGAGKLVKAAPYLTAAMSGVQGAGEQVERMREQEAQGEVIDPALRQLYALGAGAGTAALEAVPFGEALGRFAPMRRILGAIPSSVEAEAFGRAADTTLGKRLLEAGITGVGEAGTEAAQQVLQNVIEKQYNEQQAALEGIGEAALLGGIAGSALQGGAQLYRDHYIRKKFLSGNLKSQRELAAEALPELEQGEEGAVQILGDKISLIKGKRQEREERAATEAALTQADQLAKSGVLALPEASEGSLANAAAKLKRAREEAEALALAQQAQEESNREFRRPFDEAEANRIAQEEAARQLELERQGQIRKEYRESRSQERLADRKERINSLPDYPGFLPDPAVKPVEEWSPLQRNILNKYVQDMTPEQTKIFDDMTPEETRSFVDKSRSKEISKEQAAEEASLKNAYAQEGFDNFIRQRLSAKIKIDENFGIASDLARSEFKKPLGKLKDSELIALGDLIDVRRSEIESQNQELSKKAQERTQANVEAAAVGLPEFGDPVYKLQNRVAYTRFGTQYKNLSDINKGRVDSLIESGQGKTVTPEEIAEEEDFKTRETLYNRDDYRSVKKELGATVRDESGLIPVSPDTIYAATKTAAEDPASTIKPTRATSKEMFKHMIERGDVVDIEGKQYLNEGAPGPRFELPISSNPNIEQQQRAFNLEETERVIAPEIRDALKRRNLSDLFTIGLSEKIEDTPNLGQYFNRVIRLSVAPEGKVRSVKEMIGSMDHEIVHGMREAGLISDPEWALLTAKFNADTLNDEQREKYTQLYRSQGMNDQKIKEALDEEAVAMKAKELNDIDPKRLDPSSLSLINKVRYFMDFGRNTAALGYKSAEDVLAAIKSGDIGKRGFTSEFELVDGKVKRVGMKEVSPRVGGQQDVEVETKVYGEEEEAADEKYQKALSGLASKFDRKTPIKNAQQYLIQDLDIAPEDVDGIIKRMMSSGDIVRVGKSRYISDKARKSVEAGATAPVEVENVRPGRAEISEASSIKAQPASDTTQVATTTGSYRKVASYLKDQLPPGAKVLDYGAGLGLGSKAMREELSDVASVDGYEPLPSRAKEKPTYTKPEEIKKKYDAVVNLNVLNVLQPDLRRQVVQHIGSLLKDGGTAIIGTRGYKGDIDGVKDFTPGPEPGSVWVSRPGGKSVYQKGFDGNELKDYVSEVLGSGFEVKRLSGPTKSNVQITKKASAKRQAVRGRAELAPSQSQAVKNDPLANPQGSGAVTPFFVKKQPKGIIDKIKDTFKDNLSRQKMVDRYDPVRLMAIEAYSKTGDKRFLSAAEGSYHSLLFMDKAQDMALTGLETGGFKLEGSILLAADNPEIAPLKIFQRLKEKDKLDAFFNFAYAKRYRDLKVAGKDPGGTISEQDVNREYDRWANDKDIDAEIKNFKQYNDNLVDILRKSGFISVGEAKAWKSSFYIPFYRIPTIKTQDGTVDTGEVDAPKMNSQVTNLSNPKGLTGRDLSVNDAIENIVANTYYMVGTAAKNFSARKVARDGVLTGYMKPIDKPGDAAQGANVITIRENGVKKHYEVRDESLYNAVAESGFPVQDVLKGMALATEALRRGTTLSPTFIIRNTIRDTLQAWTLGRFGNNLTPPAKEMFKGIEMAYKNSPEFRVLKAAGISSSGLRKKSLSEVARAIRQEIGEEQKGALSKLYDTLERAAEISESSTRTKVYQDVLAKTGDRAEALFAAMETINFSRKGSSRGLQIAMALIPFFNARIQGLDVFYRTMRGEKMMPNQSSAEMKKAAVARFLYFVGLSSIYALLMSDHPAWVNATDEERDSNLFLPIDFIPGIREGTAIKFPIPQELGIVSKMLPERMVTMALGRSDGAELVDAMKRAVVDTLSFNPIPQVALPAVEVLGNFDFYTRRPIENQYLASLLPEDRYTEYTTGVAKLAGKAAAETPLPVSPVMVDHLIRGYFGTNGAYIADVVGRLLDMGSGAPTPERLRFSEPYLLPILGPLFKSPDGKKAVEDLYMIDEAAKMAVTTLKAYSESGRDLSEAKEEELYTLAEVGEQVKPIVEEIRELNRAKRMIQSDPDLSPSEKRDELNDLQQQIISLAKEAQEFKKEVPLRLR